jgi:hypothetical protein
VLKAMLAAYSDSELVAEALEEARSRMPAVAARLKEQLAAVEADIRKPRRPSSATSSPSRPGP